jgi:hypothetical protein
MSGHVHEPHIVCPKCSHQIPLTESIAAPLLEAERREFQEKLVAREAEFARKADELRRQQDELAKARASVEEQINQRLSHLLAFTGHRSPHRSHDPFWQRPIRSASLTQRASCLSKPTIFSRRRSTVMPAPPWRRPPPRHLETASALGIHPGNVGGLRAQQPREALAGRRIEPTAP